MSFTVTVTGKTPAEVLENLTRAQQAWTSSLKDTPMPAKATKKTAAQEIGFDLDEEHEAEQETVKMKNDWTISDVVKAFKAYKEENDVAACMKVLKKFNVSNVHDIPKTAFGDVMTALGR